MISKKDALHIVLRNVKEIGSEKVKVLFSLDRVLAEDIYAQSNVPPFDNSAMDGYALLASDTKKSPSGLKVELDVIEDVPAGYVATKNLARGQAIRIMTGAPIPCGADAVIMVENTNINGRKVEILKEIRKGTNIRKTGENIGEGDLVIKKGVLIRPAEIGLLASLGKKWVQVNKMPQVAILATGDELVDPDHKLRPGKIRNSNSSILYTQILKCGGIPIDLGIACDEAKVIKEKLLSGLMADMILVSGGISVGAYDLVKDILAELGTRMKFWKVAMKPGKPLAFGLIKGKPVFGLPGNPVSSMVSFEQFVKPAIFKMSGRKHRLQPLVNAIVMEDIRINPGRVHFIRAKTIVNNGVYYTSPSGPQGSGILRSMSQANSLIVLPENLSFVEKDSNVKIQILNEVLE
ncbi:MAG: molybdopterin molybdotransferase MoeA [Gemmatimonadota bacterium]|nr:MAG: molybdopterin molybdotransferase MoeA [Gemmatimonadota bacterium]